jgi:hypothetical protein
MGKKKLKVAIYCRVGNHNQIEHTLESQQKRLEQCAKEAGLKIVDIISDMGCSSVCMERPGWNWVLEAARQKKMQVLLVDSGDRISRNMLHLHNEIQKLSDLGVLTYSLKNDFFIGQILRAAFKSNGDIAMKKITMDELCAMKGLEGLVIQGCGDDLNAWADGINGMLTEQGILRNGATFQEVSVFEHDGRTNLLFHMDGVDLDMGRLAMWRLASHYQFGSTWLSDYLPNQLGVNMDEKTVQKGKPDCPLIGQDGNIFNLMGIASRTLKENGLEKQATEMWDRVKASGNYDEALCIIGEYVNITSAQNAQEQSDGFEMNQSY